MRFGKKQSKSGLLFLFAFHHLHRQQTLFQCWVSNIAAKKEDSQVAGIQ